MAELMELFNLKKAVEEYSEKKGYTEGLSYYFKMIVDNKAVRHSEYFPLVKRYGKALTDFVVKESTTALVDLTNILPEFYKDGDLPDVFKTEGLKVAFDNMSEYLMHLTKLYNLDYYK